MHPAVKEIKLLQDYRLEVTFDNSEKGILDMKPYMGFGVFKKLQDPALFNTAHISFDTIEWDQDIDLDPQFVYDKCVAYHTDGNKDQE
jgi:hypothetical protein